MAGRSIARESEAVADQRAENRFLTAVALVAAAGLWIPQLTSSFRLDETATHWLISGTLSEAMERSLEFQGESPFSTLIAYGTKSLFGSSELALRTPSLLAMAVAALLVYRLGRRLVGPTTGLAATIVLVATHGMTFAAGDARPYAVAIAALAGATLTLVRWADEGKPRDAVLYVVLVAAALYLHYLTVLAFVAHPVYVWARRSTLRPARYGLAVAVVGILMIPAIAQLLSLFERREHLEVPVAISLVDFFAVLVPPLLVGAGALSAIVARRADRLTLAAPAAGPGGLKLMLAWWTLPPAILYLVSRVSSTTLFEPRFFFFSAPALALLAGFAIATVGPARARRILVTGILVFAVLGFGSRTHSGDDWRAAAQAVRSIADAETPVLLRPAFIESTQIDWLQRPDKLAYLLSPLSAYPMRGDIVALPYSLTPEAQDYLEGVLEKKITGASMFLLVNDYGGFQPWLERRLPSFATRTIGRAGLVSVVLFERQNG